MVQTLFLLCEGSQRGDLIFLAEDLRSMVYFALLDFLAFPFYKAKVFLGKEAETPLSIQSRNIFAKCIERATHIQLNPKAQGGKKISTELTLITHRYIPVIKSLFLNSQFYSIDYVSIFMPKLHFAYCSFLISFEIEKCKSSNFVFLCIKLLWP